MLKNKNALRVTNEKIRTLSSNSSGFFHRYHNHCTDLSRSLKSSKLQTEGKR